MPCCGSVTFLLYPLLRMAVGAEALLAVERNPE